MNFLQLCQKLAREAEITAADSVPATVVGQTGQLGRIVGWVKDAWTDIQNKEEQWKWLKRRFTFDTVADDDTYAPGDVTDVDAGAAIARFGSWYVLDPCDPPLAYLQASGEAGRYDLIPMKFRDFRYRFRRQPVSAQRPTHISIDDQNNLVLGPKPDGVYVVTGFFFRSAQTLSANADTPEMPAQFHDLVWRVAIQMYGANAVAPEVFSRAVREAAGSMSALRRNQLPMIDLAGPMA